MYLYHHEKYLHPMSVFLHHQLLAAPPFLFVERLNMFVFCHPLALDKLSIRL
ncbi:hypothetical protein DENSPDRAFT_619475 [Dentipellis sp. KUC8613]|nr:hypothetical protein DENSPDRAFT_619475 [Dentipellis sp. KUC8613]